MVNLKDLKIYNLFKYTFFYANFFILKIIGLRNREYYFSKWIKDGGNNKMLIDYPINSDATVFDIGGYTGSFSDKIISLYNPNLLIFEPVKKYYNLLVKRYRKNHKIKVFNYGLLDKNIKKKVFLSGDSTSLFKVGDKSKQILLKDIKDIVKKYKSIDLMSINIEGAEYKLLMRLIKTRLIKRIKYLQIQFHNFIPNSAKLRSKIIKKILKTHKIRYSYPFVWESFERK